MIYYKQDYADTGFFKNLLYFKFFPTDFFNEYYRLRNADIFYNLSGTAL